MLGNQPVEVFLDSKMVQLRPYGVSKGAALEAVLEACARSARESSPNESPNECPKMSRPRSAADAAPLC